MADTSNGTILNSKGFFKHHKKFKVFQCRDIQPDDIQPEWLVMSRRSHRDAWLDHINVCRLAFVPPRIQSYLDSIPWMETVHCCIRAHYHCCTHTHSHTLNFSTVTWLSTQDPEQLSVSDWTCLRRLSAGTAHSHRQVNSFEHINARVPQLGQICYGAKQQL